MHLDSRPTRARLLPLVVLLFVSLRTGRANISDQHHQQQQQQQVSVRKLDAPAIVDPRSERVVMQCDYELRGKLYSVNWYKLDKMLFRYAPNLSQKATVFPHESVKVSLEESNARQLVLLGHSDYHKNKRAYEGTFICEVSAEHTFSTSYAVANVSVAVLPAGDPKLEIASHSYEVGEQLIAACTSMPSLPAAELSFYLNGYKVENVNTRPGKSSNPIDDDDMLSSSKLSLAIKLQRHHFQKGSLSLECRARLPNVSAAPELKTVKKISLGSTNQRLALDALRNEAAPSRTTVVLTFVTMLLKYCFGE